MKRTLLTAAALLVCASAHAAPLKVVTTTTYFADLVRRIGEDKVSAQAIAPPKFNVHFIQPKPSDVRKVAEADLYVHAGLDLEAWSDPLVEAAGQPRFFRQGERSLDMSAGIALLKQPAGPLSRAERDLHLFGTPHYVLGPENARIMARTVAEKLSEIDPANAAFYRENERRFTAELEERLSAWRALCAGCRGSEIFAHHDDVAYLTEHLGLECRHFLEPKPGVPPTPKHLESLERYASEHPVKAIAAASYHRSGPAEALSRRTGIPVVTIAQSVGEIDGTQDILSFYDTNIRALAEAVGR